MNPTEPHLPSDLAEARQARRRVEVLLPVIAEHLSLARREVEGEHVPAQDKIAAGLRDAVAADETVTSVTSVTP